MASAINAVSLGAIAAATYVYTRYGGARRLELTSRDAYDNRNAGDGAISHYEYDDEPVQGTVRDGFVHDDDEAADQAAIVTNRRYDAMRFYFGTDGRGGRRTDEGRGQVTPNIQLWDELGDGSAQYEWKRDRWMLMDDGFDPRQVYFGGPRRLIQRIATGGGAQPIHNFRAPVY